MLNLFSSHLKLIRKEGYFFLKCSHCSLFSNNSSSLHAFKIKSFVSLTHCRSLEENISTLIPFCTNSLLGQICFKKGCKKREESRHITKWNCWNEIHKQTRLVILLVPWSVIYKSLVIIIFQMLTVTKI